ncbi:MAG: 50S ribosomal protein L23 [Bdellovibrionales bacterium CG10_big_fil_rev_8_21_14_0_10_45_34]|nr:MAG: 50S ribosomal protein L23 [Bdellovibrionales bacterium CG10_big_fil_rev_8_21_14_0_10_45_34]
MYELIKRPIVTEKNTIHQAAGVYAFEVESSADKLQIKTAVEKAFNVKVSSVRTLVCRDRARKRATLKNAGRARYWKKALVQLKPGHKISIFEGA